MASFMDWIGTSPCVSHNAKFDARMLSQELIATGFECDFNTIPRIPVYCTMTAFHQQWPDRGFSLDEVADQLGIAGAFKRAAHGALLDAEICAACYKHLIKNCIQLPGQKPKLPKAK